MTEPLYYATRPEEQAVNEMGNQVAIALVDTGIATFFEDAAKMGTPVTQTWSYVKNTATHH